jgi:hypothetical protein
MNSRGGWRIDPARTADEDNAGGKGVGTHRDLASFHLGADGPSAAESEASLNHCIEERLPTCANVTCITLAFRLLKGIIDSNREDWMCLLRKPVHGLCHPVEEKGFGPLFAAVAIGSRN